MEDQFETLESAYDFVALLAETVSEAKRELEGDVQRESASDHSRRLDALRVALYSLDKLELHVNRSQRILNDLRTLRRLSVRGARKDWRSTIRYCTTCESRRAVSSRFSRQ